MDQTQGQPQSGGLQEILQMLKDRGMQAQQAVQSFMAPGPTQEQLQSNTPQAMQQRAQQMQMEQAQKEEAMRQYITQKMAEQQGGGAPPMGMPGGAPGGMPGMPPQPPQGLIPRTEGGNPNQIQMSPQIIEALRKAGAL